MHPVSHRPLARSLSPRLSACFGAIALASIATAQTDVINDPSAFGPGATIIDFAGFEVPDTVSNQYAAQGVIFSLSDGGAPFAETEDVTQRPYGPPDTTLIQNFPHGIEPPFPELPDFVIDFDHKINMFGFLIKNNLNDDAIITILCFDAGEHVGTQLFVTSFNWQFIGLISEMSFDRIIVDVTDLDNGAFRFDNLYFECDEDALCSDDQVPLLDILSPTPGVVLGTTEVTVDVDVFDTNTVFVTSTPAGVSGTIPAGGGSISGVVPLVEGSNTITVTGTDAANNVGGTSVSVIRDTIFPTVNVLTPDEGSVFGSSPVSVSLSITDATATTVTFGNNTFAVPPGGGVVSGDVDLVEGNNAITISATDEAGHATIEGLNLVLDLTAPLVAIDSPADGACFGVGEELVGVTVTVNDLTETDVVSTPPGVSDTLPPGGGVTAGVIEIVEGLNTVTVTAVDDVGQIGMASIVVLLDTIAPQVTVDSPGDGVAIRGVVDFDATVDDVAPGSGVATVEFLVDGNLQTLLTDPPYATVFDTTLLADGPHAFAVRATDAKGNVTTSTVSSLVDNTPATISITNPLDGEILGGTLAFDATVDDPTAGIVQIQMMVGGTAPNVTDGSATYDPPVASTVASSVHDTLAMMDGDAILSVVATDAAGNKTFTQITVSVDNTAPEKEIRHPSAGQIVEDELTIIVLADDPNFFEQEILVDGISLGIFSTPSVATPFDTLTLLDGRITITSLTGDIVGNVSSCSVAVTIDNMDVNIKPRKLNVGKKTSDTERRLVTVDVTGGDLSLLLAPPQERNVQLYIPGASPVTADSGIAFDQDGMARFEFDRQAVINAVLAGIGSGQIPGDGLVEFRFVVDGREIGVDNVNIIGSSGGAN